MNQRALELIEQSLNELTDFQRASVTTVCNRLTDSGQLQGRILVADEVGLGKTLVARGVIAALLRRRLEGGYQDGPFRVVYICSNLALASENASKLAVFREEEDSDRWVSAPKFGRLAELGLEQPAAEGDVLMELCTLTPATSFSLTAGAGTAWERCIIWHAVAEAPYIEPTEALEEFFRHNVTNSWNAAKSYFEKYEKVLEPCARAEFHKRLGDEPALDEKELKSAALLGLSLRSWRTVLKGVTELTDNQAKSHVHLVSAVRTQLRKMFVEACAQNLKADLFILDEFQRFRDLIRVPAEIKAAAGTEVGISEQHVIARRVLHDGDGYATLLLSATPFKALTHIAEEDEGKAHSQELTELLRYLCKSDEEVVKRFEMGRESLLSKLLSLPQPPLVANCLDSHAKAEVEATLRNYICRTERAAIEPDIERVFCTSDVPFHAPSVREIEEFVVLDRLAEAVKEAAPGSAGLDVMNLHKAAPWCMSFLGGYQLRDSLQKYREVPEVRVAIKNSTSVWIPEQRLNSFGIDLGREVPSARFKQLLDAAAPTGAEKLLWLPPSMPNYPGEGPFAEQDNFSKTLLFSSLVLAPRALSSYISYECERRLIPSRGKKPRYFENREDFSRTFRFDSKSLSPVWSLVYPSKLLANVDLGHSTATLAELKLHLHDQIAPKYELMVARYGEGSAKKSARWYAIAPFLLDRFIESGEIHLQGWFRAMSADSSVAQTRQAQIGRLQGLLNQPDLELGPPPEDLLKYLIDLAIAGPGVSMYRSLSVAWPAEVMKSDSALRAQSTVAALSFVDKMNRIESQRVLRMVCPKQLPWIAVAAYGAMGNLQAVFDEYIHLLKSINGTLVASVKSFVVATSTGAVTVTAQTRLPTPKRTNAYDVRFHCHYAVPLGNQKRTDEEGMKRITNARAAFNSPFWPFMLNSTSVGQEGLDFHWYCRRIVHWSLPANPIDLEQREGRINRYKSLVVRQRIADAYGKEISSVSPKDIWSALFDAAKRDAIRSNLVPYWHSPSGSAQIERVVPAMPFSSEILRVHEILRILSLYRVSFGQPRQQELLEHLLRNAYGESDLIEIRRGLLIDLAPLNYLGKHNSV